MYLIFLIVAVFGCLNMERDAVCYSESAGLFSFSLGHTVKKLLAKYTLVNYEDTFADSFLPITFKLDVEKKF